MSPEHQVKSTSLQAQKHSGIAIAFASIAAVSRLLSLHRQTAPQATATKSTAHTHARSPLPGGASFSGKARSGASASSPAPLHIQRTGHTQNYGYIGTEKMLPFSHVAQTTHTHTHKQGTRSTICAALHSTRVNDSARGKMRRGTSVSGSDNRTASSALTTLVDSRT